MWRPPPRCPLTDTLVPYTTLFRSDRVPVREDAALRSTNPYGRTKLVMEQLIGDLCVSAPSFHAANLRYFNPVGAHPSGLTGEDPGGEPNNLMPSVSQEAVGRRKQLRIFGGDWPTVDGTRAEERQVGKECVSTCRSMSTRNNKNK